MRMNRRFALALSMVAVAPLTVDVPGTGPDSSITSVALSMGAGSYAYVARGCQGDVLDKRQLYYQDAGFAAEHRFRGPISVGVRSTILRDTPELPENTMVWNPYASLDWKVFGFGAGYVPRGERLENSSSDRGIEIPPVSAHIRAGALERMYFSMHLFEDVPAISGGGGVARLGFGFRPARRLDLWTGLGTENPYDKPGFVLRSDIHLGRALDLDLAGRLGGSEGLDEIAGAVGVKLKWIHGSRPAESGASANPPPASGSGTAAPPESLPAPAPVDSSAAPR